ncbi:hypothetical protein F6V30_07915 [Oryzomonas sagensis]|uniref:DUF5659 domain-containing protein n=1 Tax=Oryzomonas sagensis TaxID=2603857 RepID=A0ABQ6TP31_9BACT|nr:hypothetical protein [Oryzomonas sagensis]KAB0670082.1 hypothetical protein F6V30_07915 [Oryzomonas sagensis]
MSPSERVFETESIDLASFLAASGYPPIIRRNAAGNRALFLFHESTELSRSIIAYESGAALPAKRLLNARSRLFREASAAVKGAK